MAVSYAPSESPSSSTALRLYLLGPPQLTQVERPLVIARLQVRLLLYRLGTLQPVPRDELAFLFWSDTPDATARRNLTQLLSHLRRALPDKDLLVTTQLHVHLDPRRVWSDVAAFRERVVHQGGRRSGALREAVELYRGPLVAGVSAPDHAEWESWLTGERHALEHRYLDALATLVHDATARAAYEEGIQLARRYLAVDELAEEMHRHLIELHVARGDRSAALEQYEQCVAILERELGVDPMPQTRAAYEAALAERPTNLPVPPTPLVGREREMARVVELLREEGRWLVTLTGPGGTGKTRLSLEVASRLLPAFAHGVFFVPLAPLRDPALVLSTLAQTLGVQEVGGESLLERVKSYLRAKQILIVLDNVEHVLDATPLLAQLHEVAPRLTILATSRERLRLRGETLFPVPPLAVPEDSAPEELADVEAARLFAARARDVRLDFTLGEHNSAAVAEICTRLDGLPLAIELVAARCYRLSTQAILERLAPVLAFAVDGPRDLPARQQTLRATILWSYDLLDDAEKRLFRRLAVFAGGCTVESAEAVCHAGGDLGLNVARGLVSLTEKSLLRRVPVTEQEAGLRYEMLETIREFALERLEACGELLSAAHSHAALYLRVASEAEPHLHTSDQGLWLEELDSENPNLLAALRWYETNGDAETLLRLLRVLSLFWERRGRFSEARQRLRALLLTLPDELRTVDRATILGRLGKITATQGDLKVAEQYLEQSLALLRELNEPHGIAWVLNELAGTVLEEEHAARRRALYQEALAIYRQLGDKRGTARTLMLLAEIEDWQGNRHLTYPLLEESIRLCRETGSLENLALALLTFGNLAVLRGEFDRAEKAFEEGLARLRQTGKYSHIPHLLTGLGTVAFEKRELDRSRSLYLEALQLAREFSLKVRETILLNNLAETAREAGDIVGARTLFEQSLHNARDLGLSAITAHVLKNRATIARIEVSRVLARTLLAESLLLYQQLVVQRLVNVYTAECVLEVAAYSVTEEAWEEAAQLLGASEAILVETRGVFGRYERQKQQRLEHAIRSHCLAERFEANWCEGRGMPAADAIAYALESLSMPDEH